MIVSETIRMELSKTRVPIAIFICLMLCSQTIWPQAASLPDQLTAAINAGNTDAMLDVLMQAPEAVRASLEAQALQMAKTSIKEGNLEKATKIVEAILLFNLDNLEAQELYTSIDETRRTMAEQAEKKKKEEAAAREAADKARRDEEARKAALKAEEDKRKAEDEKRKAEEAKKLEEEAFLRSVRVVGPDNFSFMASIVPGNGCLWGSGFADTYTGDQSLNLAYGVAARAEVRFWHPYIVILAEGSYAYSPFPIMGDDRLGSTQARLSIGTPVLGAPLYLSAGYHGHTVTETADTPDSMLFTALASPTIGLGIRNAVLFERLEASVLLEWLPISVTDQLIDFAAAAKLDLRLYVVRGARLDMFAGLVADAAMIIAGDGIEWLATPGLETGVLIHGSR